SCPDRIPQLELAVGEEVTALVLRHLEPLDAHDHEQLLAFGQAHDISWWLQPKGPDSAHPLIPGDEERLYYRLPQYGLTMHYRPTDFTQVNHQINQNLVARALSLLDVQSHHRVADLFCGLGNFSLPLATQCREVVGVEGAETLVQRADELARRHDLNMRTRFLAQNLFEVDADWLNALDGFDRMLIDPPREGAVELAKALSSPDLHQRPERIVMVSCNPATLARDAGILVNVGGYRLRSAGVINMFPHTSHIESIAVFDDGTSGMA
ncbi:MAG TPA: methyltransferase domain-containing protein, partial [Burkholderiaceae bacterium]|nr:methyltransferase domain-containing protein [Burkholderiaceae bacterium]